MSDKPSHNGGADDSDGDFDLSGFKPGSSDAAAAKPAKAQKPPLRGPPSSQDAATPAGPKIKGSFPKSGPRAVRSIGDVPREGGSDAKGPGAKGPRPAGRGFRPADVPPSRGAGVPRGPRTNSRDADASRSTRRFDAPGGSKFAPRGQGPGGSRPEGQASGGHSPRNESRDFRRPDAPRDRAPGGPSAGTGPRGPGAGAGGYKGPREFGPRTGEYQKRAPGAGGPQSGGGPRDGGFRAPRSFPPAGPRTIERVAGSGDHKPVHPDIKPALPLKTDKGRWKESRFLLEGAKNIADALAISSGIIQAAYITEEFDDKDLAALLKKNRVQVMQVTAEELKVLSDAETPQPIIAVANFAALKPDWATARYVTLCDAVQDPGNVGAILRTSLALGMDAVVLGKGCCDAYNPKVVRSSVGALLQLPFETGEDLQSKMEFLRQKGFTIVATSSHAPITLDQAKVRKKVALIMGNEGAGTGATYLDMADTVVKIPLKNKVESLNVSVAHGILSYQLMHGRA
ncbi:MAG: hypothetical protein JF616_06415 [Fibrobacteres bacterium]|nr:hypothetical protein [Fibrobacterota bacterium]